MIYPAQCGLTAGFSPYVGIIRQDLRQGQPFTFSGKMRRFHRTGFASYKDNTHEIIYYHDVYIASRPAGSG